MNQVYEREETLYMIAADELISAGSGISWDSAQVINLIRDLIYSGSDTCKARDPPSNSKRGIENSESLVFQGLSKRLYIIEGLFLLSRYYFSRIFPVII